MFAHFIPATALLAATVQPVSSTPSPPLPSPVKFTKLPEPGQWEWEANEGHCGLAAWVKDGARMIVLWMNKEATADDYRFGVSVSSPTALRDTPTKRYLRIDAPDSSHAIETDGPSGQDFLGAYDWANVKLDRNQTAMVLGSKTLTITRGDQPAVRMELAGARSIAMLDGCQGKLLKAAGLDPSLVSAVSHWPSYIVPRNYLFSNDDYPKAAMAAGAQGTVRVMLNVDPAGRVAGCRILRSSGNELLDLKTCEIYLRRGSFNPALNKAGKPVPAPLIDSVTWSLAE